MCLHIRQTSCLLPETKSGPVGQGGTQTARNQQAERGKDRWEARPAGRSSERRRNALLATRARNLEQTASQRGAKRRERVRVWETHPPTHTNKRAVLTRVNQHQHPKTTHGFLTSSAGFEGEGPEGTSTVK